MSKVKFIQWGTPTSPKAYSARFNTDGTMADTFSDILSQYPGGVIFVTYYKDNTNKGTVQEIWANGVQYSVGGGGGGNIIYGTTAPNSSTGKVVIDGSEVTGDDGYIYVYKSADHQTAYYWDNQKWNPFNVDAENVWFHDDITLAGEYTRVGNFTKEATGTAKVKTILNKGTASFNLLELMTGILSKAVASGAKFTPTTSRTAAAGQLSISQNTTPITEDCRREVGTTLNVSAQLKQNSSVTQWLTANTGTYGYKDSTGEVIMADYSQQKAPTTDKSDSCQLKKGTSAYSNATFEVVNGATTFTASTSTKTYTGVAFDSVTITPLNNLGEDETAITPTQNELNTYLNKDLTPNPTSPSITITGYWPCYYGSLASEPSNWTSADFGTNKKDGIPSSFSLAKGHKVVFVAVPSTISTAVTGLYTENPPAPHGDFKTATNITHQLGSQTTKYTVYYSVTSLGSTNGNTIKVHK